MGHYDDAYEDDLNRKIEARNERRRQASKLISTLIAEYRDCAQQPAQFEIRLEEARLWLGCDLNSP